MKKLLFTRKNNERHWVGNAFPVRTLFSYNDIADQISPFLLMDYAGPYVFTPTSTPRGVGEHPHRGFETVTIVYEGEVTHKDSAGGGGTIKPDDVQWMTAASGLVHEEFHSLNFSKTGGNFEMVQLWINLPTKDKMSKPRYQGILSSQIPKINLLNEAGTLRIISGEYAQAKGPAKTFSKINLWDIRLNPGKEASFQVTAGDTCVLFVLSGSIKLANSSEVFKTAELVVLESTNTDFSIQALEDTKILFLGGTPLNETIVGHGPFVMNTMTEINQAIQDYQAGLMGNIDRIDGSEK
ncbi:MAG: pirin family protein [Pseudobdellovibrio sp.]